MPNPPSITDRPALMRHRQRADEHALFLHHEAVAEVQERLRIVKKQFIKPAIITPFPALWQNIMPDAHIIADDDLLDLAPQAHDLVIHAMALHWANDPVGQLVQCRRALVPDGLFLGLTLGGQTLHELRTSLAYAESRLYNGLRPRVLPMAEIRDLGVLLQRARFNLPVADGFQKTVSYQDMYHLMRDLRAMGESNALAARSAAFSPRALFDYAAHYYAKSYGTEDGRIIASFDLICLTGWAFHDSQQKPLRPGSALQRLEDALSPKKC